jgi:hypothetical protein
MTHEAEHRILHQIQRLVARNCRKLRHAQRPPFDGPEELIERV